MDWAPMDKRIGRRRQIRSVPMAWCRDPNQPDPFGAEKAPDGNVVELSVSGAGLVAVSHPYLTIGGSVLISCVGLVGLIIVRRMEPEIYPGETYYGVEFGEPKSALAEALQRSTLTGAANAPSEYLPRG